MKNIRIEAFVQIMRIGEITAGELRETAKNIGLPEEALLEALGSGESSKAAEILGVDQEKLDAAIEETMYGKHSKN